ncbi:hypothetical protein BGZ79_008186 [Entomortierella chlamydospora]|nr:hypothetical protein BGZ79_008186 [Entomortierella chlamydospora]
MSSDILVKSDRVHALPLYERLSILTVLPPITIVGGNQQRVVIYFDGEPPEEKLTTQLQRQQSRNKAQSRASNVVDELRNHVDSGLGIRKAIFSKIRKYLRECFRLSTTDRDALIAFLKSKGWIVVLCETEADVRIAEDCQVNDIVISRDSDMLIYTKVKTLWRPIGHAIQGKFLVYKISIIFASLGLTRTQLTSLGVISRDDYTRNIPILGIAINYSLVKRLDGKQDVPTLIHQCLELDSVVLKNVAKQSFSLSINVFVNMRQTPITATSAIPSTDTLNYTFLRSEFDRVCKVYAQLKKERQNAKLEKSTSSDDRVYRHRPSKKFNRYRVIDRPPPEDKTGSTDNTVAMDKDSQTTTITPAPPRPRYSFRTRTRKTRHPPPKSMKQYEWKPWTKKPDNANGEPDEANAKPRETSGPGSSGQQPPTLESMDKKQLVRALTWDHPQVSLHVGTLRANVKGALKDGPVVAEEVVSCLNDVVAQAHRVNIQCQGLIGASVERVLALDVVEPIDRSFLDYLCPRIEPKEPNGPADDKDDRPDTDMDDEDANPNKYVNFLRCLMTYLHSGNYPNRTAGVTADVTKFIQRLQQLGVHTPTRSSAAIRQQTVFPSSIVVRSVASQLAAELKRMYTQGSHQLVEKINKKLEKDGDIPVDIQEDWSAMENFVFLNRLDGGGRRILVT